MIQKLNTQGKNRPCILLAPLDWGLGHATRCVPIIRILVEKGCDVVIAAEGKQLNLLQLEFPNLQFIHLQGYRLEYSNNRWKTIVKLISQIPKIIFAAAREHRWLNQLATQKRIDAVISDNRYGFFLRKVPSILITHQLNIQTPFGKTGNKLVNLLNFLAIQSFDSCWVPDLADEDNFGGVLSHPRQLPPVPVEYLGPLTRFLIPDLPMDPDLILVLISGPEPQRGIFEAKIRKEVEGLSKKVVVVRGLPGQVDMLPAAGNMIFFNHLPTEELAELVAKATFIVARPGYSTVMEMLSAGKKCLFVPTPGQSEQEYLGRYLNKKNYAVNAAQEEFSLISMLRVAENKDFRKPPSGDESLKRVVEAFVRSLINQ
ncbi:MAG: glycosyltransferase family protein [Chitinophagaceae bacterium]